MDVFGKLDLVSALGFSLETKCSKAWDLRFLHMHMTHGTPIHADFLTHTNR